MGKLLNLTNNKFGNLTVIELDTKSKSKKTYWKCQCICGNFCIIDSYSLRTGHTKSCGCLRCVTRYTKNDNYWNEPNIENSYWAGLIAADGCIETHSNHSGRLRISLTKKDKNLLDRLKICLEYNGPIFNRKSKTYTYSKDTKYQNKGYTFTSKEFYSLQIAASQQYIEDLERHYNITPHKSLTLIPPNITDENHIKAFIIGYFDGDGSLFWHLWNSYYGIKFVGTLKLLEWIKEYLEKWTNVKYSISSENSYFVLSKYGKGVLKFHKALMNIDVPRLERKWDLDEVKRLGLERAASKERIKNAEQGPK